MTALAENLRRHVAAMKILHHEAFHVPFLTLVYTGIDAMAWLACPDNQEDVTRADFVSWVDTYFPADFLKQCSSLDLYAARCGVVHSFTSQSKLTRAGANQLWYASGSAQADAMNAFLRTPEGLAAVKRSGAGRAVAIQMEDLGGAFELALKRFVGSIETDNALGQRVAKRVGKLFSFVAHGSDTAKAIESWTI